MDVEVIKCTITTKKDLQYLKELFILQEKYPDKIFILDYTKPSNMLIPDFEYIIYIDSTFLSSLLDAYFSLIGPFLEKYGDDLYYDVTIDSNDPRRVYKFEPYTIS